MFPRKLPMKKKKIINLIGIRQMQVFGYGVVRYSHENFPHGFLIFFSKTGLFWISIIGYLGFSGFEYVGMDWYQGMDGDLVGVFGYFRVSIMVVWIGMEV